MICLSHEEFGLLHSKVTEFWQPMVEFLVASGARWGEVAALKPGDVDRKAGTVRISRSWKQGTGGYRLGATKTKKSKRTINVPQATLDKLDYTNEFLFVNRAGGPVRAQGFSARVWIPAVRRAWPLKDGDCLTRTARFHYARSASAHPRSETYQRQLDDPGRSPAASGQRSPRA